MFKALLAKSSIKKKYSRSIYKITALLFFSFSFQIIFPQDGVNDFSNFTSSYIPSGICCDGSGNVIVASVDPDNVFQELLTKYSSNGSIITQVAVNETGRMKYDNNLNKIWMLVDHQFYLLNPSDLSINDFFNISNLEINTDDIYDISIELPFPTYLDPYSATYSDFDFLYRGNQIDVFVAGFYQAWHFILRIRLIDQEVQSSKVIVTSGASLSPYDNSPHGVTVNSQGIVLTTLGWGGTVSHIDQPVIFGVDYPENQDQIPQYLFDEYDSFSSRGMTTDQFGNFYIASGWVGGGSAGGGASCLIVIPASLNTNLIFDFSSVMANPRDVSIDRTNGLVYITDADMDFFGDYDCVWVMSMDPINVKELENPEISFNLFQNYPNPFNPTTTIKFTIPEIGRNRDLSLQTKLVVYNSLGQQVNVLVNEEKQPGVYEVKFSASSLSSGIYFYRLQAGDPSTGSGESFISTKKMIYLK